MATSRSTSRRKARSSGSVATEATKWLALLITSGAALVSFLSDSSSIGLFGWVASEGLSLSDYVVRSVRLTPRVDTASSISDTLHFAATITDKRGSTVIGATVSWSSLDPEVATVDSSGGVVARGPGEGRIVAAVREYVDTAKVVVRQDLAGVRIDLEDLTPIPEEGSRQLYARAVDARRHEILGVPVRWSTSDSAVLAIDSLGRATGLVPGEAVVVATAGSEFATAMVRVVPAAGRVDLVEGNGQHAEVRTAAANPVRVRVWSRGGTPLVGATVRFIPLEGSGAAVSPEAVTDRNGEAESRWMLGSRPGIQQMKVAVEGADSALLVSVEAEPNAADFSVAFLGDSLSGVYGERLPREIRIQATDSLGRALPGLRVGWSTPDGGSLESPLARTDSLGMAVAYWTLGPKAGSQTALAQVGDPRFVPPLKIAALALAGEASRAEILSGGNQQGKVAAKLADPIRVRAIDEGGNPVPGVAVTVVEVSGSVVPLELTTNSDGVATLWWTLGRESGRQTLEVQVKGVGAPLVATATAAPLGPANVEFLDHPTSGTAGKPLGKTVIALVTDAYGNPVADRQVFFSGPAGVVNPQRRMTDSTGRAATSWTLGNRPGPSWLQAAVSGTKLKTRMEVTVKAN